MRSRTSHPTDDELLLLDDPQGLGGHRGCAVTRHVAECARCAARRSQLAAELAEVTSLWRGPVAAEDPERRSIAAGRGAADQEEAHRAARVRLAAALDSQAARDPSGWPRLPVAARMLLPAAAAALVALALVTARPFLEVDPSDAGRPPVAAPDEPTPAAVLLRPDRRLTPGAVRPVTAAEACRGDLPSVPATAAGVPREVFARYGIDYGRAAEYELDFLITPELGGAADPRNLWPQPYGATVWNAYVKDELEQHLGRMVCAGTLDLATAQRDIATDWIGAYRRYFDTTRPRRDYRRFPLTGRDGETPAGAAVVARRGGGRGGLAARTADVPTSGLAGAREALPQRRTSPGAVDRRS